MHVTSSSYHSSNQLDKVKRKRHKRIKKLEKNIDEAT